MKEGLLIVYSWGTDQSPGKGSKAGYDHDLISQPRGRGKVIK